MVYSTRCFHFDADTGKPLGSGCSNPHCRFAHPKDPEWKHAAVSRYIPDRDRRDDKREDRRDPVGRGRSPPRAYSPPHRRHYDDPPSSRRSDRPGEPSRSSLDRARSPRSRPSGQRARNDSVSSSRLPTETSPAPPLAPPPATPPVAPMLSRLPSSRPPPPSPISSAPVVPPPPPTPPSFLQSASSTTAPPLSVEELRETWTERVRLLADGVRVRERFDKLKDDINKQEKYKNTEWFAGLPEEGQQQAVAHIRKLQIELEEWKQKLDGNISQLAKTNPWPIAPSPVAERGSDNQQEVIKSLEELAQIVARTGNTLDGLRERKASITSPDDDSAMDVDSQTTSQPKKRRRLSNGEHAIKVNESEADALRDRIMHLEEMFSNFGNDLNGREEAMRYEIDDLVDSAVQKFVPQPALATAPEEQVQDVQENIETTGKQVEELAGEIGNLIDTAHKQESELDQVKRQLEESRLRHLELQERMRGFVEQRERDTAVISAVEKALDIYTSKAPAPRIAQENLLHYIEEPIQDMVRETVQPLIEDFRLQVEKMLETQSKELYRTLWEKLQLVLKMVENISQQIETQDADTTSTAR